MNNFKTSHWITTKYKTAMGKYVTCRVAGTEVDGDGRTRIWGDTGSWGFASELRNATKEEIKSTQKNRKVVSMSEFIKGRKSRDEDETD